MRFVPTSPTSINASFPFSAGGDELAFSTCLYRLQRGSGKFGAEPRYSRSTQGAAINPGAGGVPAAAPGVVTGGALVGWSQTGFKTSPRN